MSEHFNGLSPAEAERLAMLAEECGEVIQAVGKVLRHGYESFHPDDLELSKGRMVPKSGAESNRDKLTRELSDLVGVMFFMEGDVALIDATAYEKAIEGKLQYTHHQTDAPPPVETQ